jgi:hypothetical protein
MIVSIIDGDRNEESVAQAQGWLVIEDVGRHVAPGGVAVA